MIIAFLSAFALFLIPLLMGWVISGKPKPIHTLILGGVSFLSFFLWKRYSPYPSPLNWDIWEHQTIINAILNGHHALFPSQLSDTFGFTGYTTLFHYILSVPQYLFHPDILGFWWASELYMVFLTSFAAYGLTYAISKNRATALIAGIISSLYFESSIVFAPYFVLPQTLAAIIWVFGLVALINAKKQTVPWIFGITSLILLAMHLIIGGAGVLLYILYFLLTSAQKRYSHAFMSCITILFPLVVYTLFHYAATKIPLNAINFGEAAHYVQTISQMTSNMRTWYGFFPILFIPLGLLAIAKTKIKTPATTILTLFLTLLAVVLSPLAYSMKFYVLFRYLFILVIACGVHELMMMIGNTKIIIITALLLFMTQCYLLSVNIAIWQTPLFVHGIASHISSDEQEAIAFLKKTYDAKTTLIVSDPATSYLFEALSGINSLGGAYMKPENRTVIANLVTQKTSDAWKTTIVSLQDPITTTPVQTYVFVVSARYLEWSAASKEDQQAFYFNIWRPRVFTLKNTMDLTILTDTLGVQPVFQNDAVRMFSLQAKSL